MKNLVLLLFSISIFSQSKPIEIKIDSLKSSNTDDGRRDYLLQYHISNLTDKPLAFVLDTSHLVPIGGGSLRPNPYYKIYENATSTDVSNILSGQRKTRTFKDQGEYNIYMDSLVKYVKNQAPEEITKSQKERFLENIQKLEPKETKYFTAVLAWDKNRYFKNDVIEYYIEEKEKHFFELHINLMVEELLMNFSEEEKKELLKDKALTKGWFTSNKMEIDFSE